MPFVFTPSDQSTMGVGADMKRKNLAEDMGERPAKRSRRENHGEEQNMTAKMTSLQIDSAAMKCDEEEAINIEAPNDAKDIGKATMKMAADDVDVDEDDDDDEGEDDEATYVVLDGRLKNYEVRIIETNVDGDPNMAMVVTTKNARGNEMRDPVERKLKLKDLRLKDSYDMIEMVSTEFDDDGEDRALLTHEKDTWECPKCGAKVSNEHGFCPEIVGSKGSRCGSAPKMPEGGPIGWGGCFAINQQLTNTWKCGDCYTSNDLSAQACAACEAARP